MPDPALSARPPQGQGLTRRFWRDYLRRHTGVLVLILLLMAAEGGAYGAVTWAIRPLFDQVFAAGSTASVLPVGLFILGLFLFRATVATLARRLSAQVTQAVATTLQRDLLGHLLAMDLRFFLSHPPGQLMERVVGDTRSVQGIWSTILAGGARDGLGVLALLSVALMIDVRWTLYTLIGLPIIALPVLAAQRLVRRKAKSLRAQAGRRSTRLDEILHGIQTIKLNQMEGLQQGRFAAILARTAKIEVNLALVRSLTPALLDITFGVGFLAVLLIAGPEVARGERTVGEFMSFFTSVAMVFQPLRRMGEMSGSWAVARASLDRIYALLETVPGQSRPHADVGLSPRGTGDIIFADVHFAHGEAPVLRGLGFSAKGGQMTALVGASGAGKSTVFHLLTGLFDPDRGAITLDGVKLIDLPLSRQRGLFAVVTQDAAMFDETLRDNILPAEHGDGALGLDAALRLSHVAEFLPRLEAGLETPVGPRGARLSGGQRQRVAIARALTRDAPILLLDEATSALDSETESAVADALREGAKGRTVLVIAHRLSTIRAADHIVVMDQGRAIEEGRHAELLARGGTYARLCALQSPGEPDAN